MIPSVNHQKLLRLFSLIVIPTLLLAWQQKALADVVKPALIEISVYSDGHSRTEIRASIEALLTGINGRYKNTKDSPNADEYDRLRKMSSDQLRAAFKPFHEKLLKQIELRFNGQRVDQQIESIDIPPPGYTKVPRISVIVLRSEVPRAAQNVRWYYPLAFGDNAVRVRQVNQASKQWHWSPHEWIREDRPSQRFSLSEVYAKRPLHEIIVSYIEIGFQHIIPMGLDHILFILGIFLLSPRIRPLLGQVTMFTVAHTLTLGLTILGYIELSPRIVEPLIALSIAYVGIENLWAKELHRSRIVLVFGFGLLHGMGFAGALSEFGMPNHAFIPALISFNVGVELGQIAVLSIAFLLVGAAFSKRDWYRSVVTIPASISIGVIGLYWAVDRMEWLN